MPKITVFMVRACLVHLALGATFGGLMLANKGLAFEAQLWRLLYVHADVMLFGWMIQLAMGVASWILPRFARKDRYGFLPLAWSAFGLLNGGIVIAAYGFVWGGSAFVFLGRLLEVLSVAAFTGFIWSRIKPFQHV